MPILSSGKIIGVLSICSKQKLSAYQSLIEDFTKIYGNYSYILNKSERDKLTRLFNRRIFDKKLRHLLQMQRNEQGKDISKEDISLVNRTG